jgi:hypothetical protein
MAATSWVTGTLLVGGALAFMLLRERWRLRALEALATARNFELIRPFVPEAQALPAKEVSDMFSPRGAIRWGAGMRGELDGVAVWILECEASRAGRTSAWYTLVAWPVAGPRAALVLGPAAWRQFSFIDLPEAPASPVPPDPGGWEVTGESEERAAWLTPGRSAAMAAFSPPCVIAIRSGYACFRVEGPITPARVGTAEAMLAEIRKKLDL